MHIHIATLGEKTDPVIKGLKTIPGIEKVYIIYSEGYEGSKEVVANYLEKGGTPCESVPVSAYDFDGVMNIVADIQKKEGAIGRHEYSLNVTGGTKLMAFSLYSSAYFIGATVYYVQDRDDLPLNEQLLTILTTRAPKTGRTGRTARKILGFIYERTANRGTVSNQDIEAEFGMTKQQVSYYIRNLRGDGLITVDSGLQDPESGRTNYRFNSIRLTQQGFMEAKFTRDERFCFLTEISN